MFINLPDVIGRSGRAVTDENGEAIRLSNGDIGIIYNEGFFRTLRGPD